MSGVGESRVGVGGTRQSERAELVHPRNKEEGSVQYLPTGRHRSSEEYLCSAALVVQPHGGIGAGRMGWDDAQWKWREK